MTNPPSDDLLVRNEPQLWYTPRSNKDRVIVMALQGDGIKLTAGLKPNIWTFIAFAQDLFPLKPEDRFGKLELRISRDPSEKPLVTFDGVQIIDTEPDQLGVPQGSPDGTDDTGPTGPNGEAVDLSNAVFEPITMKVFIADERCRFQPPRGGLIELGEFNVPPLDYIKNIDARGRPILGNKDLLSECLAAMGYEIVDELKKLAPRKAHIPSSVDDYPKQENVSWRGQSAAEEFERLLKLIGHTVAYQTPGGLRIFREGTEPDPEFAKADVCAVVPDATIDRRPVAIVVSSAPTSITEVRDFSGISDAGFQYVWLDVRDGKYKLQKEIDYLANLNLIEQLRNGFADVPPVKVETGQNGSRVVEVDVRKIYDGAAFSRIRLNPDKFPGVSFYAKNPDAYHGGFVLPTIYAKTARLNKKTFRYEKGTTLEQVRILNIQKGGTVIATEGYLLNIDVDSCAAINYDDHIVPLGPNELVARLSHESFDDYKNRPKFFHIGFFGYRESFQTARSDAEIAALDAEITISRPECHLIKLNDEDANRPQVEDLARQAALNLLPATQSAGKTISLIGWKDVRLSPRVACIHWKRDLITIVYVNAFGSPGLAGNKWEPPKANSAVTAVRGELDTSNKEVVYLDGGVPQNSSASSLFYVSLASDGGSDGNAGSKPSYTYAVRDESGKLIGEHVVPTWQRALGSFRPAETGVARLKSDGTVQLISGDEVENVFWRSAVTLVDCSTGELYYETANFRTDSEAEV